MANIDKKELAKLSPENRIKRLKELEEENKKQIAEAEKLIKSSEEEIKNDRIERLISVPETKKVDISELFEKPKSELEQKAKEAEVEEESPEKLKYMVNEAYEQAQALVYQEPNEELLERVDALGERIEKMKYHTLTEEVANKVVAVRSLIYKIKKYSQQDVQKW